MPAACKPSSGSGCFPIGKTPRDAMRLVHLSPTGKAWLRQETAGALRCAHIFRYPVGAIHESPACTLYRRAIRESPLQSRCVLWAPPVQGKQRKIDTHGCGRPMVAPTGMYRISALYECFTPIPRKKAARLSARGFFSPLGAVKLEILVQKARDHAVVELAHLVGAPAVQAFKPLAGGQHIDLPGFE